MASVLRADMNRIHVLLLPKFTKFSVPSVYVGTYRNVIVPASGMTPFKPCEKKKFGDLHDGIYLVYKKG